MSKSYAFQLLGTPGLSIWRDIFFPLHASQILSVEKFLFLPMSVMTSTGQAGVGHSIIVEANVQASQT